MAIHYNNTLPFRLEFTVSFDRTITDICFWDTERELDRQQFIELREMVPVSLSFTSHVPSSGQLFVETARLNEEGETLHLEMNLPTIKKPLFSRDTNSREEEFPWRMGYYLIKVIFEGTTYYSGIRVIPNNLNHEQVDWLHQYLEEKVEGLCFELIQSQRTFAGDPSEQSPEKWYYDYARWILSVRQKVMACLQYIERYPYDGVLTQHEVSTKHKKQDMRSERWANSFQGLAYNQGMQPAPYFLNRVKILEQNIPINQWLKYTIVCWKNELQRATHYIRADIQNMTLEESTCRAQMAQAESARDSVSQIRDIIQPYLRAQQMAFKTAEKRLHLLQKRKALAENLSQHLKNVESLFAYFLNRSFIRDCDVTMRKPMIKNRYYRMINDLYEESLQIQKNEGDGRLYRAVFRPTWRIYEYFALFQIISALQHIGFQMVEGLPDSINHYHEDGIREGTRYVLRNDDSELHLHFNKQLHFSSQEARRSGEAFYSSTENRWPDYKIDFYRRQTDNAVRYSGHSMVLDAKLSKLSNLYNIHYPIKPFSQLTNYFYIHYCGTREERALSRPIVDRVYCLYAGYGEIGNPKKDTDTVSFIRLCPVPDSEEVCGQMELQEAIMSWLTEDAGYTFPIE